MISDSGLLFWATLYNGVYLAKELNINHPL